jgi:hypothetical protein
LSRSWNPPARASNVWSPEGDLLPLPDIPVPADSDPDGSLSTKSLSSDWFGAAAYCHALLSPDDSSIWSFENDRHVTERNPTG